MCQIYYGLPCIKQLVYQLHISEGSFCWWYNIPRIVRTCWSKDHLLSLTYMCRQEMNGIVPVTGHKYTSINNSNNSLYSCVELQLQIARLLIVSIHWYPLVDKISTQLIWFVYCPV